MRVVMTGQVGLDKKAYLDQVELQAKARGVDLKVFHVGQMMYREAPDVRPGHILDLPLSRLNGLRRAIFRDILAEAPRHEHVIVNTHATFRWKHGLFSAFDFDHLALFNAELYVTLLDNVESVYHRMLQEHQIGHSLKDLMVWREEEILATEILARANPSRTARFIILSRGRGAMTCQTLCRLIFEPQRRKVYPSFPMSHVYDLPETMKEIGVFREKIAEAFVTFDPGDVDEKLLYDQAVRAAAEGQLTMPLELDGQIANLKVSDVLSIGSDINGQIYARDFMMVRQSDLIISYIPELPSGKPGLSSGVERELQHGYDHAKEVYVIWKPRAEPSPFITQTATAVFRSTEEALAQLCPAGAA